jgi:hypothetical protein
MEGHYVMFSSMFGVVLAEKPPYVRLFRQSLLETMVAEPGASG